MMKITGTTKLGELLNVYPETFEVFMAAGFPAESKETWLETAGEETMLKTLLSVSDINEDLFLYQLEKKVLDTEEERKFLLEDFSPGDQLDFYGNTICPLKFTFKDALEDLVKDRYKQTGEIRRCYVEAGRGDNGFCDDLWMGTDIETFPNLLFSKEFNQYLGKNFMNEMCGKGYFETNFYGKIDPKIQEAGILDDQGDFCVYGVMADIFLIDKKQLGDLPIPKTTADLLNPIYKDKIIIFGKQRDEVSNATLLYIQKEFGEEGLLHFARNIKCALHGATMSKVAGSDREEAGAIYIVSGFFANTCTKGDLEIIWPEDGSMVLPMYMLVKKDGMDRVKDIVDYVTGDEFAQACIKAFTPVVNGNVKSHVPTDAKYKWLGWEYIRENDIEQLASQAEATFLKEWHLCHEGKELLL